MVGGAGVCVCVREAKAQHMFRFRLPPSRLCHCFTSQPHQSLTGSFLTCTSDHI